MADSKISQLTLIDALALGDGFVALDDSDTTMGADGTDKLCLAVQVRSMCLPAGYLFGCGLSNNGTDPANDIDIAVGELKDETNTVAFSIGSTLVKRIDATWAEGTNQGGMNTGSVAANTWYEVHLIRKNDGTVDAMFTTAANRATLPTNYVYQRRIGWVRTNATPAILAFTQVNDHFTLTTQINDASFTATATAAQITLTVPPNTIARFRGAAEATTAVNTTNVTVFSEIVEGNVTPTETTGIASLGVNDVAGASAGHFELRVNGSSQIEHDSDGTTYTVDISTFGWIDDRRKLSAL